MNSRAGQAVLNGIYALLEPERRPLEPFVEALLAGGVRLFQIRAKHGIALSVVLAVVARIRAAGGLTIVNDDVELALNADGVHLGQEDAANHDLVALRRRLGAGIIGLSCGTPHEAERADPALIDYIGIGPFYATASKADAGLPIGAGGVAATARASRLPTAAIGGISLDRIPEVRSTGVAMAAIVSALAQGTDAESTARKFVAAWKI